MDKSLVQIDKFNKVLLELIDAMSGIISDLNNVGLTKLTGNDVNIIKLFISSLDKKHVINTFIDNSSEHWDKIKEKNDEFFINNSSKIFGQYANYEQFNALKIIFSKNQSGISLVDDDTKESIREYLFALIKISIVYIFNSKEPVIEKTSDNKVKITYKKTAFTNIDDLMARAKKWNIKLFN